MAMRWRSSGSMRWSWVSSPRLIWTQLILPVNELVLRGALGRRRRFRPRTDVGPSSAEKMIGWVADAPATVLPSYERVTAPPLARPPPLYANSARTWWAPGGQGLVGGGGEGSDPEEVVGELRGAVRCVETPTAERRALRDDRAVGSFWVTSISAVTEYDLFLMLMTLFSDRRAMPGRTTACCRGPAAGVRLARG